MEDKIEGIEGRGDLEWGYQTPQSTAQRIKENVPKIGGLDEGLVLKGHIFERILGDDRGEFGAAALWFSAGIMKPAEAMEHKNTFLNRLRWEAEQPQTPQAIKDAIAAVMEKLQAEWDSQENVKAARAVWEEKVRSRAQTMVDTNEEGAGDAYQEYLKYFDEVGKRGLPF